MKQNNLETYLEEMNVVTTKLVREKSVLFEKSELKLTSPELVYRRAKEMIWDEPQECLLVFCLDTKGYVTTVSVVHKGTLSSSVIHPRDIFRVAILSNANSIIVCHNHPSGDPTPSRADILVTQELERAGKIMDIHLQDHVIIGDEDFRYFSFKEKGIL